MACKTRRNFNDLAKLTGWTNACSSMVYSMLCLYSILYPCLYVRFLKIYNIYRTHTVMSYVRMRPTKAGRCEIFASLDPLLKKTSVKLCCLVFVTVVVVIIVVVDGHDVAAAAVARSCC